MRKLLLLIIVASSFLVSCSKDEEVKRYEVIVTEKHGMSEYIVKTYNYKVTQIWFMDTENLEFEIGDITTVAVVNEHIVVPYVEYIDMTIDGYKYVKGEGWKRVYE